MAQLTILGRNLKSLSRHKILVWFVQSVMTAGHWLQPSFFLFLQMLSWDRMFSVTTCFFSSKLISGRDMNSLSWLCYLSVVRILVMTSFFLFPGMGVATSFSLPLLHFCVSTSIRCRDLFSIATWNLGKYIL